MRLLINTATTFKGGGVQVAKSFIEECKAFPYQFTVVLGQALSQLIDTTDFPHNFKFYKIDYRPATRVFSVKDQAAFLKKVEEETKPDVVFTTSGPAYWRPKAPHLMGYNLPHYIYPDSPFFQLLSKKQQLKWKLKGALIKYYTKRDADAYVVQTDDVKQRLKKWIHASKVTTVTNTYGNQYNAPEQKENILPKNKSGEFRLLLLSGYYQHKNIELINGIVPILKHKKHSNIKFILSLPEEEFERTIAAQAKSMVKNVGPQKPQDCPQLYRECEAVFLPTLLECFSATYAEAMKMKVPIITTDLGFAHSICEKAALYFKPLDAKDAADKILKLEQNKELQQEMIANGEQGLKKFNTAEERAKKYLEICQKILKESVPL